MPQLLRAMRHLPEYIIIAQGVDSMRLGRVHPWLATKSRSAFALLLLAPASAWAQGIVTGRVTEQGTGAPVQEARVLVVGTSLVASTGADGRYTVRGVPAGTREIRVLRIGLQEQKKPVTVVSGGTQTLDFALETSIIRLSEVVTTATGPQRRAEMGTTTGNIDAARVAQQSPATNLQEVLNARVPGVQVMSGGQTGTGARVRIRGNSSLNLSNEPIYVIDGIRMTSNQADIGLFVGGALPSRVGDLNPEEIESIEVVKGPAAATLYGTDAANGVILITTKKGRAGAARWNTYVEAGRLEDLNDYPTNYTIRGHTPGSTTIRDCNLRQVSLGTCIQDSVAMYSPLLDPDATPIGTGYRTQYGLNLSGGTETLRYFIAGEREDETGLIELPAFERRRFELQKLDLRRDVERPNALQKYSFRSNLNASVNPKLDLGVTSNFINVNQRYALESNATAGIGSQAFGGRARRDNGFIAVTGDSLIGYRAWTPGYTFQQGTQQRVNRLIGGLNANYRPYSWLSNRANVGLDYASRVDESLLRRGEGPPITSTYRLGFANAIRANTRNFSFDLGSTGSFNPREGLNSKTTVGAQYVAYKNDQTFGGASDLPIGTQTPNSGAQQSASYNTTDTKTLGVFIEQQIGYQDRLFVTGAVRSDQNSAFGTEFQQVFYPKAAISWVVSEESFFPKVAAIDQFRLRAAWGAAGVQPGPNDALRTFGGTTVNLGGVDAPGVIYTAVGNPELRPERTTEFEGGFDLGLFGGRSNLELTYYSKTTEDALIEAVVAPSAGAATRVNENLGSVKNAGLEGLLTMQLVDRESIGFEVSLNGSLNDNKLVSLGGVPEQIFTITRATAGYPLFGFWERPITGWEDKNGDGILTYYADPALNEVFVGDSTIFRGYSSPRYQANLAPALELFGRSLRIQTMFDYRGGNLYYNNTERIRCRSRDNCNGGQNPNASFEEQAMVVASRDHPAATNDGYFQPGSFVRWRELSATYSVPESLAGRFLRSRSASVNFAARNLKKWTKYRGIDPEIDRTGSAGGNIPEEFQTLGNPSYFILRLNVGF